MTLSELRGQRFFPNWDAYVSSDRVQTSEGIVRNLVDDLIALGAEPSENEVRDAVDECIQRFNAVDDGWIATVEREDICEQVCRIVEICGFECDDDWLDERDW